MTEPTPPPHTETQSPSLQFDFERYAHHLAELELTEEQAREVLGVLWGIMVQCVDLGFGIHPVQQAERQSCGQDAPGTSAPAEPLPDMLSLVVED